MGQQRIVQVLQAHVLAQSAELEGRQQHDEEQGHQYQAAVFVHGKDSGAVPSFKPIRPNAE
ncbi:hypothetical protein D3C80_1734270 [compost metagenome]